MMIKITLFLAVTTATTFAAPYTSFLNVQSPIASPFAAPAPQTSYSAPEPQMAVASQSSYAAPAPQSVPSSPLIPIVTYNAVSDDDGNYKFKYLSSDGTVREERGQQRGQEHIKDGTVRYTSPDGQQFQLTFTADKDGYRPQGDHLPTPPPVPQVDAMPSPYSAPLPQAVPVQQSSYAAPAPQMAAPASQPSYAPVPQAAPQMSYTATVPQMAAPAPQSTYTAPAPQSAPSSPLIPIVTYNAVSDDDGNYKFKYLSSDGTVREERGQQRGQEHIKDGTVRYTSPDGQQFQLTFTADKDGYRPQGDHLPTPPPVPQVDAMSSPYASSLPQAAPVPQSSYAAPAPQMAAPAPQSSYAPAPVTQMAAPAPQSIYTAPAPQSAPSSSLIPIVTYNAVSDDDGNYKFKYLSSDGTVREERGQQRGQEHIKDGTVRYTSPDGQQFQLTFTADKDGYRPQGDHLPTPPPVPQVYAMPSPYGASLPQAAPAFQMATPEPQSSYAPAQLPQAVPAPQSSYAPAPVPQMVALAPQSSYAPAPVPQTSYTAPSPQSAPSSPLIPIVTYNAISDDDGNYRFKYLSSDGTVREESGQQNGNEHVKDGSVKYNSPDGQQFQLTFTADKDGYRPQGDHLPTPPPVPQEVLDAIALIQTKTREHLAFVHNNKNNLQMAAPAHHFSLHAIQSTVQSSGGY